MGSRNRGFTLVELVAVIIVVGILAAFTVPRFTNQDAVNARGVYDSLASALRYAKVKATASNCPVRVDITATGFTLERHENCDTGALLPVKKPGGGEPFSASSGNGISLNPTKTITFKATGATQAGNDVTIDVMGANTTRSLTVIGATGYVETQ